LPFEIVGNLHVHTWYSDGEGSHEDILRAALDAGLDFIVVTDHNVWVEGLDGYYYRGDDRVLLLIGEEVHDQGRHPQKNHLLAYGAQAELAPEAADPRRLVTTILERGGLAFLAHPHDPEAPIFDQPDLSWVDWDIQDFTGLELWNFMSEFKSRLRSLPAAIFYAYNPGLIGQGPFPQVLKRWDQLLAEGRRVVAIGGTDAHATHIRLGPLERIIFPYAFLFRTVNTHVLLEKPLLGDPDQDRRRLFEALRAGACFVGYDLPAPTRGFRFSAHGERGEAGMGGTLPLGLGVTLKIHLPSPAEIRLLRNGRLVRIWEEEQSVVHTVREPGAYRVEAHRHYRGRVRGWIYSNPIHLQGA